MTGLARNTDPATSHAAAARSRQFAASHASRIMAALMENGPSTAHDLSKLTGLTVVQIDRRLPELAKAQQALVSTFGGMPVIRDGFRVWEAA